jgi:hypothetical protein
MAGGVLQSIAACARPFRRPPDYPMHELFQWLTIHSRDADRHFRTYADDYGKANGDASA